MAPSEGVQSIDRAVAILDCFSADVKERSLGEIASLTHLPKPTVFRILSALKQNHWVEQDEISGLYRLGYRLYTLGAIVASHMDLRSSALPIMRRLRDDTGETVNLNIIDRGERVCIELEEAPNAIRHFVKLGTRNSLTQGASGLAMLAFLPEGERAAAVANETEERVRFLKQSVELIRKQGYAITYNDRVVGACGISAPVFDRFGKLCSGLTVSGPAERIQANEEKHIQHVVWASRDLSARLGFISSQSDRSYSNPGGN